MPSFTFRYKKVSHDLYRPIVPIQIRSGDGSYIEFGGILDSGSDVFFIPKHIAELLDLNFRTKTKTINGIGGEVEVIRTNIVVKLGSGENAYKTPIRITACIQVSGPKWDNILIGRNPFFKEFLIEINENKKRIRFTPTRRH